MGRWPTPNAQRPTPNAQRPTPNTQHPTANMTLPTIDTGHDQIPDFAHEPTITSIMDGDWFSTDTWSGARIPERGDIVKIEAGHRISIHAPYEVVDISVLGISGTLTFQEGELYPTTILVYESGSLALGARATIRFHDEPPTDPEQFGTGLIVLGALRNAPDYNRDCLDAPIWARLQRSAKAGSSVITIQEGELAYRESALAIADTGPPWLWGEDCWLYGSYGRPLQIEEVRANSTPEFGQLNLNRALKHEHREGAPVVTWGFCAIITSVNPQGVRGHCLFTGHAHIDIRYMTFIDLGRTTAEPLDPVHNHIGRYPVHLHHLHHEFSVLHCSVVRSNRWGIAVHGSSNGTLLGNVIYDVDGAGIVTEQGNERNLVIDDNCVLLVKGHPALTIDQRSEEASQRSGSGFWINCADAGHTEAPGNIIGHNIACNTKGPGFNFFCPHGNDSSVRMATQIYQSRSPKRVEWNEALWCSVGYETWLLTDPMRLENCHARDCQRGLSVRFNTASLVLRRCRFTGQRRFPGLEPQDTFDHRKISKGLEIDGGYLSRLALQDCQINNVDVAIYNLSSWSVGGWHLVGVHVDNVHTCIHSPTVLAGEVRRITPEMAIDLSGVELKNTLIPLNLGTDHGVSRDYGPVIGDQVLWMNETIRPV